LTLRPYHQIILCPTRVELRAAEGTPLRDLLFEQGVEFPCGGQGRCRGCRVRVLAGKAEVNRAQQERLSAAEIAQGWRLACQCTVESDLEIELRQWDAAILVDDTPFAFRPRPGLGVAVDLGTTTLVAQLLDLTTGKVLAVSTALNAQARYGADVMSRLHFAVLGGGQQQLESLIRRQIGALVEQLLFAAGKQGAEIADVVVVGNTVMHHFFCGIAAEPLTHYPFEPAEDGMKTFTAGELGWKLAGEPKVRFLPCLGGFVGSDVLAGILAAKLTEHDDLVGLVDLGTNGEIVIGNREGLLCASTAAGPAFEGAKISMGMRASTGAISQVSVDHGALRCRIIGDGSPCGLCGSGLVDAVGAFRARREQLDALAARRPYPERHSRAAVGQGGDCGGNKAADREEGRGGTHPPLPGGRVWQLYRSQQCPEHRLDRFSAGEGRGGWQHGAAGCKARPVQPGC